MLKFKGNSTRLQEEFEKLDRRLLAIVFAVAGYVAYRFGKDLIITSVYRRGNKSSTHYWYRGVDFRIRQKGQEFHLTDEEVEKIERFCTRFRYSSDPKRKRFNTLRVKGKGGKAYHGTAPHGHLQVNPFSITEIFKGD